MKTEIRALFVSAVAVAAALSFRGVLFGGGLFSGLLAAIYAVPIVVVLAGTFGLPALSIARKLKWNAWWHSVSLGITLRHPADSYPARNRADAGRVWV